MDLIRSMFFSVTMMFIPAKQESSENFPLC